MPPTPCRAAPSVRVSKRGKRWEGMFKKYINKQIRRKFFKKEERKKWKRTANEMESFPGREASFREGWRWRSP